MDNNSSTPLRSPKKEDDETRGVERKMGRARLTIGAFLCFLVGTLFQNTQVTSVFNPRNSHDQDTETTIDEQLSKLQAESRRSLEEHTKLQEKDFVQLKHHMKLQLGNVSHASEQAALSWEERYSKLQQSLDSMKKQHDKEMAALKEELKNSANREQLKLKPQSAAFKTRTTTTGWSQQLSNIDHHATLKTYPTTSPYAYVLMCWSVNPRKSYSYRGYIANMAITAKILRTHGSTADIVAVFRLDNSVIHETLPQEDENLLRAMNISIRYLPQETPDFSRRRYSMFFHKFYAFGMTEYRRVFFLDGDIMPMTNLDYMFQLSDDDGPNAMFKPNVIIAGIMEPCNTGFFIVEPTKEAYNHAQNLIRANWATAGLLKEFDMQNGWGHPFVNGDHWENNLETGVKWDFMNGWSDQGLHYHLTKYVMQNVTQIFSRKIVNWGRASNGSTIEEKVIPVTSRQDSPLRNYSTSPYKIDPWFCKKWTGFHAKDKEKMPWPGCVPPYSDFDHYSGTRKVWHIPVPDDVWDDMPNQPKTTMHLWYQLLYKLKEEDGLDIQPLLQAIDKAADWDKILLAGPSKA
ncbi:expressed unknown protein [Seminavis robusta]|uniref:Hexosyltransferase n=1 Tax=Seminavis robusta TaxID=568900 RepID=A0A9N8E7D2_9STRA|nr:expressed unknown protein [Seminavis robusta]|eukprot:Sro761_g198550.1 n/a (574) ;mRNA; f:27285-29085